MEMTDKMKIVQRLESIFKKKKNIG